MDEPKKSSNHYFIARRNFNCLIAHIPGWITFKKVFNPIRSYLNIVTWSRDTPVCRNKVVENRRCKLAFEGWISKFFLIFTNFLKYVSTRCNNPIPQTENDNKFNANFPNPRYTGCIHAPSFSSVASQSTFLSLIYRNSHISCSLFFGISRLVATTG